MIPENLKGRFVYHFTSVHNLRSIIYDGLLCTNLKIRRGVDHVDIANSDIQKRRSTMEVTCGPRGVVHDYVPFYFAKRTPMLLNIIKLKNIDQIDIIYLAIPIEKIMDDSAVFSDASANTKIPPKFYKNPQDLNNLDWRTIDSWSWTYQDENKNRKMAEMLIHEKVNITDVSHIVVWNKNFKNSVKKILADNGVNGPKVVTDYYQHFRYHYFTKISTKQRENIVTGPRWLKYLVDNNIKDVFEFKQDRTVFFDLKSSVDAIIDNFCCIKELNDIEGLETDNPIHRDDVGKHSRRVAQRVRQDEYFGDYSESEQNILVLSALLHDIGKGPKSRWLGGIQKVDDDHPRKSLPMLKRILCEEIGGLSKKDIRRIHMLVVYDDLIGDIVANGRDKNQLFQIVKNKTDVDLLISLGRADMGAIHESWVTENREKIEALRQEAYEYLEN
ncbi:DarT ssDNA thymidine ADP-ribosyltransferase family protein [Photobacterium phosphoreum]|uniref:type II toxin-antitoxin system toxin DNA ADP-ribosyl transferase DarT n=1 Tax=Photobacterium phosphoreum TaxID=659 RepID=UPI0039AEB924